MRTTTFLRAVMAPALVVGAAIIAMPAGAGSQASLADVRLATSIYHDPAVALDDDYADIGLPCFTSSAGGMGDHLVDGSRIDDGVIDPLRPEALVYDSLGNGELKLVAVEYIAPRGDGYPRPSLWGVDFNETTVGTTELWTLHAWLWRGNPSGVLATWNPSLETCS